MQARLTVRLPEGAAIVRMVPAGESLRIGRSEACDLRVDHPSVSRRHAELRGEDGAWRLLDCASKNGSFVDGARVAGTQPAAVPPTAWLRLGDVYCEFVVLDDDQAAAAEAVRRAQRRAATAHTARIDGAGRIHELLDASLAGVIELAQCERGFVLLRSDGGYTVAASQSLEPSALSGREFSGSVGAVQASMRARRSIIVNDVAGEAWLSSRASVVASRLSALVCMPLLDAEQVLGAIYADRTRPGMPLTTLDQELLEAFSEHAALWIAARRASEGLLLEDGARGARGAWEQVLAAHRAEGM